MSAGTLPKWWTIVDHHTQTHLLAKLALPSRPGEMRPRKHNAAQSSSVQPRAIQRKCEPGPRIHSMQQRTWGAAANNHSYSRKYLEIYNRLGDLFACEVLRHRVHVFWYIFMSTFHNFFTKFKNIQNSWRTVLQRAETSPKIAPSKNRKSLITAFTL